MHEKIRVRIFYPADPVGTIPGGVDAFLRGLIKWAPEDIDISLVGATADSAARPVGSWSECMIGAKTFKFLPVTSIDRAGQRTRVPLSLRYTVAAAARYRAISRDFAICEFHRIEPAVIFLRDHRPKSFVYHTDMSMIGMGRKSDVVWRHSPGVYRSLERLVLRDASAIWCVSSAIVEDLLSRYPTMAEALKLLPNWVDPEVFRPLNAQKRRCEREAIAHELGADPSADWIVFVGRLDTTKDPELLLNAFKQLPACGRPRQLLFVGDGRLRSYLRKRVSDDNLEARVHFAGLRTPAEVARILAASDTLALTSTYEGMPIAVLEALGCGIPVATTDVGDVSKVVTAGRNGAIASDRTVASVAAAIDDVLQNKCLYGGTPATDAVRAFHPEIVLRPVYARYRDLAADMLGRTHKQQGGVPSDREIT